MGVILYKDIIRNINELLTTGCKCIAQGYPNPACLEDRIALLERREDLELKILKQLGWA